MTASMTFTDQMGNVHEFERTPSRIVSIVPSQTEFLYYLGVKPIAQTLFCIHPKEEFKQATKIGGTKKLNIDKILELNPDLVIGNKEENDQAQIEELQQHVPVWMSDINDLDGACNMIELIGQMVGKSGQSKELVSAILGRFNRLITPNASKSQVLYLIWNQPYFGVGSNTFIHSILDRAGYTNVLQEVERYPEITPEYLQELNPEIVFLSSEPFPFKESHKNELQEVLPSAKIAFVDGELFSWYGNRLLQTPDYLDGLRKEILNSTD